MEKEGHQPESLATVTIKPDYAPSETYSSEPPPAYHRPKSTTVQVARIISFTIIAVSVIIGCFILASAYVTANASCSQLQQEIQFLSETADRMQPLQPEALIQEEQANQDLAKLDQKIKEIKEIDDIVENKISSEKIDSTSTTTEASAEESDDDEDQEKTIHIKMPLELDFDDLAGTLMEKNQRSRMNCIVEKKRAEQVVDHQPKTIQLPFGVNLTTDPRFEHLSGERMAIFCESGNEQSHPEPEHEEQEETIMIQPIMIPIPHTNFQTHMPMQVQPHLIQHNVPERMPIQAQQQQPLIPPPHPMETMRPPMPVPIMQQQQSEPDFPPIQMLHRIAQQIIAQKIQMEQSRNQDEKQTNEITQSEEDQQQDTQEYQHPNFVVAQRMPIPEEILSQIKRLPNNDVVIALSSQEQEDQPQEQSEMQQHTDNENNMNVRIGYSRQLPDNIPLRMVQVQQESQPPTTDEMRPHYVHPRSVRSVDNVLPKTVKRVKRCSCDCAC